MSVRPAKQQPAEGDLRRRLIRHYLPLAAAIGVSLALFMAVSPFDANKYTQGDIFSGTFPRDFPAGAEGNHGGAGAGGRPQHGGQPQQSGQEQGEQQQGGQSQHAGGSGQSGGQSQHGGGSGQSGGQSQHGGGGKGSGGRPEGSPQGQRGATPTTEDIASRAFDRRFTVATGYVALGLLGLTLLIGPANLMFRRRNPISSYLRRDVGAVAAVFSTAHFIISLQVHGTGQIRDFSNYFVADGSPLRNSFGLGNWTGLAGVVIVIGLLGLSNDLVLRKLRARNWKRLQRLNYLLFALVLAHSFFYGAALRTDSPYSLLLLLSLVAVIVGQALGIRLWRQRRGRRTPAPATGAGS